MTVRRKIFNVDYDSDLGFPDQYNRTIFKLALRVHLSPMNPEHDQETTTVFDITNQKFTIQRWTDAEWTTFTSEFKKDAETHLNWPKMELYLLPSVRPNEKMSKFQILYFVGRDPEWNKSTPYVQCGLTIELVADKNKAHVAFRVIRLKDGEPNFRAFDVEVEGGEDWGVLTNRSIDLWNTQRNDDGVVQNVVSHELGHVLGLSHINANDPRCLRTDGNAAICGGAHGTPQYNNLMGYGNRVTAENAGPWMMRIPAHADSLSWWATTRRPDLIDL